MVKIFEKSQIPLPSTLSRRQLLTALLPSAIGLSLGSIPFQASSQPLRATLSSATQGIPDPTAYTLLVAAPGLPSQERWKQILLSALKETLPGGDIQASAVPGQDGVSGANQFDTRPENSSHTALLVPGSAIIAALAGDPRVHFDFGRWIPIFKSLTNCVVVGPQALQHPLQARFRKHSFKVAVSTYIGAELPTLLALHLLNFTPLPIVGMGNVDEAVKALLNREVDIIQMDSKHYADHQDEISKAGFGALFSFNATADTRAIPTFSQKYIVERNHPPQGLLYEGWQSLASATTLETACVMPMLTPPQEIAQWRHAINRLLQSQEVVTMAKENFLTLQSLKESNDASFNIMQPSLSAQLAIKRWLTPLLSEWK
ncbi:hypothetical protein [Entomobacter blattae]|uniref:Uncharacterized protein n=1 Tax=Entomobacter blattae TaxID=2762277 RepID=A0A7H1NRW3_9PROT|nr:hypothetical protein [Entomobacter blattae]QNT78523.1 hypothetical protein JGUZn3_12970 [Entomobacter blattae]